MNGSFCNLCALALGLALHVFATRCGRVPRGTETAVYCCDPALSVLVMFGVLKRLSRSINPVYCLSIYFFWLVRSLVDPTLAAFIVCGLLQFMVSLDNEALMASQPT